MGTKFNQEYRRIKQDKLSKTISSPENRLDTNSRAEKSYLEADTCDCWSPKVEFVKKSTIHTIEETFLSPNSTMSDPEDTNDLSQNANQVKVNGSPIEAQTGVNNSLSSISSTMHSPNEGINSLKRFLRFYNRAFSHHHKSRIRNVTDNANINLSVSPKNDLLEAFTLYPSLYHLIRRWHLFHDAQSLFGNLSTADLLVGNRVRVYRSSGTTQWYTAVIISHDERTNLLTLIDDTVLEEHHEDPTLLEMHLIDDELIHSIIEGDDGGNVGSTRRRTQRSNQRLAAQTAQIAILNSSTTSTLPASNASQFTPASPVGSPVISRQQQNKSLSLIHSSLPLSSSSFSSSSSSSSSSPAPSSSTRPVSSIQQLADAACRAKLANSSNGFTSERASDYETAPANVNAPNKTRRSVSSSVAFTAPSSYYDTGELHNPLP